jgi:hypothetical protein
MSEKVYTPLSYLPLDVPLHIIPNLPYGLSPLHELYPGNPMTIYYSPTRENIPNPNPELDKKYLQQKRKETQIYIQEQKDLNKLPPKEQRVIPLPFVEPEYVNESPSLNVSPTGKALPELPSLPQSSPISVFGPGGKDLKIRTAQKDGDIADGVVPPLKEFYTHGEIITKDHKEKGFWDLGLDKNKKINWKLISIIIILFIIIFIVIIYGLVRR